MATDKKSLTPQTNAQDPAMPAQPATPANTSTPGTVPGAVPTTGTTQSVVVQGAPVAQPQAPAPTLGPDGKPIAPLAPGDPEPSLPNAASHGQGTTQEDADKAAGGNYRVLYPITYGDSFGNHQSARPGDIVTLTAEDAKGLLANKAVESADTSGADQKRAETDPRKIQ